MVSAGEPFLVALEASLIYFIREGCIGHMLQFEPFGFVKFQRALAMLETLLRKFSNTVYITHFRSLKTPRYGL